MHCRCCDKLLSDFESTRKNADTGEYLDMCNKCFEESGLSSLVNLIERQDLIEEFIPDEEKDVYFSFD